MEYKAESVCWRDSSGGDSKGQRRLELVAVSGIVFDSQLESSVPLLLLLLRVCAS